MKTLDELRGKFLTVPGGRTYKTYKSTRTCYQNPPRTIDNPGQLPARIGQAQDENALERLAELVMTQFTAGELPAAEAQRLALRLVARGRRLATRPEIREEPARPCPTCGKCGFYDHPIPGMPAARYCAACAPWEDCHPFYFEGESLAACASDQTLCERSNKNGAEP